MLPLLISSTTSRRPAHLAYCVYSCTWNVCAGTFGGDINGLVLWCIGAAVLLATGVTAAATGVVAATGRSGESGLVTPATHSASKGSTPNGDAALIDCARPVELTNRGARLIAAGDVFFTTSPNHWSALGSGATISTGRLADNGGDGVIANVGVVGVRTGELVDTGDTDEMRGAICAVGVVVTAPAIELLLTAPSVYS